MMSMSKAARCCGAMVTAAVFFMNLPVSPSRAADDLPMVGDIPMPDVRFNVNVDDDLGPPPPPRPRFVYPQGPYAAIPPARFAPVNEGSALPQVAIARMLHATGYTLLGQINQRGWVYTVSVINPRGDDGRAIIDARTGAVIRFIPAMAINARLDGELSTIYGPPGPPPVARGDVTGALQPKPVARAAKRDAAPKLADRMPASAQPSTTASVVSRHEPEKPEAAKSSVVAGTTTGIASASASSEQPAAPPLAPAPSQPARELKLWPTQAMPDVQTLE